MAPDFTLPDLAGTPHTLSSLRGKQVFLCTWASW
jgi:peroxiredoxin